MTGPGYQQNSPYPPPWPPVQGYTPAAQRSVRGPVIIAAAIIAAALIVAGVLVATRGSGGSSSPGAAAASSTSTASSTPALVQVVPATLLPDAEQIRRATLMDVKFMGEAITKVAADSAPTPAQCALTDGANTLSAWEAAISVARQRFGDGPDYDKSINFGVAAVAIFDTTAAAAASFAKVSDSVHGCTTFTTEDPSHPGRMSSWTVAVVADRDGRLAWISTLNGAGSQWQCAQAYRVQVNIAVQAMVCQTNPGDGPSKLTDQIVANATKK